MAFCTECGKEFESDHKFCSSCGAPAIVNTQEASSQEKTTDGANEPQVVALGSTRPDALKVTNKQLGLGCLGIFVFLTIIFAGVSSLFGSDEESQQVQEVAAETREQWEILQERFLAEIEESAPDYFLADSAALTYLKQYCEIDQYGDAGETDVVDRTVAKYCNTALAEHLGVEEPKVQLAEVDEAEFTRIAGEKFGVFEETYEDGSSNTPVSLARYLCEKADVTELERNLGDSFETSFQWFALETFCPQKLG